MFKLPNREKGAIKQTLQNGRIPGADDAIYVVLSPDNSGTSILPFYFSAPLFETMKAPPTKSIPLWQN